MDRSKSFLQMKWLGIPVVVLAIVIFFSAGVAIALVFNLDTTVPATVDIVSPPPPPPTTTPAKAYSDAGWQNELSAIHFGSSSTAGGSLPLTVYVKPSEINVTTVQATGVSSPYAVSVTSTNQATGAVQLTLVVPAGRPVGAGVSVGQVRLTGTGPAQ